MSRDLPPGRGYDDGRQRTEQIKETIGHIDDGGDAQHRRLRHSAGVPRDKHGGYGCRILASAAQQSGLIALTAERIAVDVGRQHDGDELVARRGVQE